MKNFAIFLFLLSGWFNINIHAQTSQWQHLSGSHRINTVVHDGHIVWFGTDEYGIGKYDRVENSTTYFNTENSPIPSNKIHQLQLLNGSLWMQSDYKWFVFDGQNWAIFDETNSLLRSEINGYDIAASKNGTIWLSYRNGLFKFNGNDWTNIHFPEGEFNSFIPQIDVDAEDNLWLSGSEHLLQYDGSQWKSFEYVQEEIMGHSWVSDLKIDSQENIWMSLSGYYPVTFHTGGLIKFDRESKWTVYSSLETGSSLNSFFLNIDKEDKIWVTSNSNTIVSFNGQDFISYSTLVDQHSMNPSSVAIDADNQVWIGTNRGLERLEGEQFEEVKIEFPETWLLQRLATKHHFKADNIWFRSINKAVSFNGENWETLPFEEELEFFKNQDIGRIVPTSDGSLWVISNDKIYQCSNGECIEHMPIEFDDFHGKVNDGIEDREGNIWFVVNRRERLVRFDGSEWMDLTKSMEMAHLNLQYGHSIYGITFDHENDLWISTSKGKLFEWNGQSWRKFDLRTPQDFSYQSIHDIAVDDHNQIWVAHREFLKLFDQETEEVIQTLSANDLGIMETHFWNVTIDSRNNDLWVGTQRAGVLHFNGHDWQHYHMGNSPLSYNSIDYILIDPTGHKWIVPQYGGFDIFREEGVVPLRVAPDPGDEEEDTHPDYGVGDNIPNPFTESTRIPIELSESSWVRITITDGFGQIVGTHEQSQMEAGKHYFLFEGNHLKPNTYFFTIDTKNGRASGKIIKQ